MVAGTRAAAFVGDVVLTSADGGTVTQANGWEYLVPGAIASVTPSQGFPPERQRSQDADVFLVTLDPGTVVTFVAELRTGELPQLTLWEPNAYKDSVNAYTLYRGIVLGISGLLALFLTILFVVQILPYSYL